MFCRSALLTVGTHKTRFHGNYSWYASHCSIQNACKLELHCVEIFKKYILQKNTIETQLLSVSGKGAWFLMVEGKVSTSYARLLPLPLSDRHFSTFEAWTLASLGLTMSILSLHFLLEHETVQESIPLLAEPFFRAFYPPGSSPS